MAAQSDNERHDAVVETVRGSRWGRLVAPEPEAWLLTGTAGEIARAAVSGGGALTAAAPPRGSYVDVDTTDDFLDLPVPRYEGRSPEQDRAAVEERLARARRDPLPGLPPITES